jgi:hypothetical protein
MVKADVPDRPKSLPATGGIVTALDCTAAVVCFDWRQLSVAFAFVVANDVVACRVCLFQKAVEVIGRLDNIRNNLSVSESGAAEDKQETTRVSRWSGSG